MAWASLPVCGDYFKGGAAETGKCIIIFMSSNPRIHLRNLGRGPGFLIVLTSSQLKWRYQVGPNKKPEEVSSVQSGRATDIAEA